MAMIRLSLIAADTNVRKHVNSNTLGELASSASDYCMAVWRRGAQRQLCFMTDYYHARVRSPQGEDFGKRW